MKNVPRYEMSFEPGITGTPHERDARAYIIISA